ncbi:hypothetical protein HY950_03460 [Candidatus Gottesmanbacteria bacterium]|nr:hypothetical protein [Candidatus Gottesmanbacteria bacterium]
MWYTTYGNYILAVRYATSPDGINWTRHGKVNVPTQDLNSIPQAYAYVLKTNNEYKMWYTTNNGSGWKISLATSQNGVNWTPYSENPVLVPTQPWEGSDTDGSTVLFDGTKYEIYYHGSGGLSYATSTDGIHWDKPADKNPVITPGGFDFRGATGPSALRLPNNTTLIYYTGFGSDYVYRIGLATDGPIELPTPTPTATPTPAPTPTPTPLPPVVIVPGMMASWNKEAILEGQANPSTPWKMLPFVTEYTGLVETLKHLGYTENQNLYLWPYDWRKTVATVQTNLDTFLNNTVKPANPGQPVNLVGHSLGGLVTRAWTQSGTNQSSVGHLITPGSPHAGVVQAYQAWSGGDLPQKNSLIWLAERLMLELNRKNFATDRETIQSVLPVIRDILPTAAYLTRQSDGQLIDPSGMTATNAWLTTLNTAVAPLFPVFDAITGTTFTTPDGFIVAPATWLDTALGNWTDGKPVSEQTTTDGDTTVTRARASFTGDPSVSLNQNHGNTIASADGIDAILDVLSLPHAPGDITAGSPTTVTPGALFLLRSPATLRVMFNGTTYDGPDGIIFIPGASSGTYSVELTGTGSGSYTLVTAQLTDTTNVWRQYSGTITPGATRTYSLSLNMAQPSADPAAATNAQRLDEIDQLLTTLTSDGYLAQVRRILQLARSNLSRNRYIQAKANLENMLAQLSLYRRSQTNEANINTSLTVSDKIVDLYHQALSSQAYLFPTSELTRMINTTASYETNLTSRLSAAASSGQNITRRSQRFVSGQSYRTMASEDNTNGRRAKARITYFLSQLLFREAL